MGSSKFPESRLPSFVTTGNPLGLSLISCGGFDNGKPSSTGERTSRKDRLFGSCDGIQSNSPKLDPTQKHPLVTPPSAWQTCFHRKLVSPRTPNLFPHNAKQVAQILWSSRHEQVSLTNLGLPDTKTTSSVLVINFFFVDIKCSPGNSPEKYVFSFKVCSVPHETAFLIPKAGNTDNQTGQPSEIAPTKICARFCGEYKPRSSVPFDLTESR